MEGIEKIKQQLKTILVSDGKAPLLLGDRGCGKTESSFQIGEELNIKTLYMNCQGLDSDEATLPYLQDGKVKIAVMDLPEDIPCLLILDEITNATDSGYKFLLSFIRERRIRHTHFPKMKFIATGNRLEQSSLARAMPHPLMERFCILDFPIPTLEEWSRNYAHKRNYPAYYIAFLRKAGQSIFYQKGNGEEDYKQLPSPRQHSNFAEILRDNKLAMGRISSDILEIMQGYVGEQVSSEFALYLKDKNNFYSWEDFLADKKIKNQMQLYYLADEIISRKIKDVAQLEKAMALYKEQHRSDTFAYIIRSLPDNIGAEVLRKSNIIKDHYYSLR